MSSKIAGKHIVFTGKMEQGDRGEMKADAKKLGALVQSDVNSKTDILVHGSDVAVNSKHRKMNKAQELGITILEEQTYYDMIQQDCGSYLSIIPEIYEIFQPVIEASRGGHTWKHGAGASGTYKLVEIGS